jgi:hypothetical protein
MFSHNQAVLWIPVFLYSGWLVWPQKWKSVMASSIGFITYVPFALHFSQFEKLATSAVTQSHASIFQWLELPGRLLFGVHVRDVPRFVFLSGLFLLICPFLVIFSNRSVQKSYRLFYFFALAFFCGSVLTAISASLGKNIVTVERYFAPLFAITALAAAWWLKQLEAQWFIVRSFGYSTLLASTIGCTTVYFSVNPFFESRTIVRFLKQNSEAQEPVILYGDYAHRCPMMYYYPQYQASIGETEQLDLVLHSKQGSRFWILLCTPSTELVARVNEACEMIRVKSLVEHNFRNQILFEVVMQ